MLNIKLIISVIAIILTFIGYIPYFRDIFSGKTKPHIFSWLVWGIITFIIYALQVSGGAGLGSIVTLMVAITSCIIFLLGLKQGDKNIKFIDIVFLVVALLSIPLWLVAKQPILSIIILTCIDMLAFAPTVRKSWNQPYSETLSLYVFAAVRHGLSFLALVNYSLVTYLFPVSWVIANSLFVLVLIMRRKKIKIPN